MNDTKVEKVARWLNMICCDWPPFGYDWEARGREAIERRRQMRDLARDLLGKLDD